MITSGFRLGFKHGINWFNESSESSREKAGIPLDSSEETLEAVGEKRRMA